MGTTGATGDMHDTTTISVLLVGDHLVLRDGLQTLLQQEPDMTVAAAVSHPEDAIAAAGGPAAPIVVIVGLSGRPLIRMMRALQPAGVQGRTIVLTTKIGRTHLLQARQLGVSEFLLKDSSSRVLIATLHRIAARQHGVITIDPAWPADASPNPNGSGDGIADKPRFGLTSRELEIVAAVRRGDSNRAIARRFSLSEDTVKHHLTRVFDKTGVFSRLELAMFAIKHGLGDDSAVTVNN